MVSACSLVRVASDRGSVRARLFSIVIVSYSVGTDWRSGRRSNMVLDRANGGCHVSMASEIAHRESVREIGQVGWRAACECRTGVRLGW